MTYYHRCFHAAFVSLKFFLMLEQVCTDDPPQWLGSIFAAGRGMRGGQFPQFPPANQQTQAAACGVATLLHRKRRFDISAASRSTAHQHHRAAIRPDLDLAMKSRLAVGAGQINQPASRSQGHAEMAGRIRGRRFAQSAGVGVDEQQLCAGRGCCRNARPGLATSHSLPAKRRCDPGGPPAAGPVGVPRSSSGPAAAGSSAAADNRARFGRSAHSPGEPGSGSRSLRVVGREQQAERPVPWAPAPPTRSRRAPPRGLLPPERRCSTVLRTAHRPASWCKSSPARSNTKADSSSPAPGRCAASNWSSRRSATATGSRSAGRQSVDTSRCRDRNSSCSDSSSPVRSNSWCGSWSPAGTIPGSGSRSRACNRTAARTAWCSRSAAGRAAHSRFAAGSSRRERNR